MSEPEWPFRASLCPVCGATDAFVEPLREQEYYVECVNCQVYRVSKRAFRLFHYLRDKADPESLQRLSRLAAGLRSRDRGPAVRLEYETWESL